VRYLSHTLKDTLVELLGGEHEAFIAVLAGFYDDEVLPVLVPVQAQARVYLLEPRRDVEYVLLDQDAPAVSADAYLGECCGLDLH
jgi:hypothetical protein